MRRSQRNVSGHHNLPPLKPTQTPDKAARRADVSKSGNNNKHNSVKDNVGERKNASRHGHEDSEMTLLSAECYNRYENSQSDRYVDQDEFDSGRFMCSPAPREFSGDSITSSDSSESKVRPNMSGFPAITVERCDERYSSASHGARSSSNSSSSSSNRSRKFEDSEVTTNLLMPSPVMQRKYKNGRPVVITPNLQDLRAFSKSDGHLHETTDKAVPISPRSEKIRLDASFRPQAVSRPIIHPSREVSREEVEEFKASRSPSPSPRRLRVRVTDNKQRARSTSDVNSRR